MYVPSFRLWTEPRCYQWPHPLRTVGRGRLPSPHNECEHHLWSPARERDVHKNIDNVFPSDQLNVNAVSVLATLIWYSLMNNQNGCIDSTITLPLCFRALTCTQTFTRHTHTHTHYTLSWGIAVLLYTAQCKTSADVCVCVCVSLCEYMSLYVCLCAWEGGRRRGGGWMTNTPVDFPAHLMGTWCWMVTRTTSYWTSVAPPSTAVPDCPV